MKLLKKIDELLNGVTMYRLLLYGLCLFVVAALAFSFSGGLSLSGSGMLVSLAVLLVTCYVAQKCLAVLFSGVSNSNSWLLTALILFCILPPTSSTHTAALVGLGGLIAMASKYVVAYNNKHLFNPAAFAAVVLGLTSWLPATWWIGSPVLLPFTAIFGLLILRKIRRFQLFWSFLVAALVVTLLLGFHHHQTAGYLLKTAFESSPLVFLGTIMLTEPATTPPRLKQQWLYGLIVGALFSSQLSHGFISATPELALIIGNVFSYIVSPKYKLKLQLLKKTKLSAQLYDFTFSAATPVRFRPGQYLEWTLAHDHIDNRGNRRVLSIASEPDTNEIHIAVRVPDEHSTFKTALMALKPGDYIAAGQLAGDFTLPNTTDQKLVFIAGGIGITPFVSMAKAMIASKQQRDIVLFYIVSDAQDYCYQDVWQQAASVGLRVVPILSKRLDNSNWTGAVGRLTDSLLQSEVPDFQKRRYYLSGPTALVTNYELLLRQLKVGTMNIVTDHFSGY